MTASTGSVPPWTSSLARDREKLHVGSTAQRVVGLLRGQVLDGTLRPGMQLVEEPLVDALGVSRNTVREALSLLSAERLVEHRRHKGMFVRRLGLDELADLCGLRRSLEVGALREAAAFAALDDDHVGAVVDAAASGRAAADAGDWTGAGSANAAFHLAMTALAANPRLNEATASVIAEMRLAFVVLADPKRMHGPYVDANRELAELVASGKVVEAVDELDTYLHQAQRHLIAAYGESVESVEG